MIKRRLGETLSTRGFRRQNRAILLKVVTHNILILLRAMRFSTQQVRLTFSSERELPGGSD